MIIECPHCRTKFSIDDSLVARSKSPKFHCSRCDNYFTETELSSQPDFAAEAPRPRSDFSAESTDFDYMTMHRPATDEDVYRFEEFSTDADDLSEDLEQSVEEDSEPLSEPVVLPESISPKASSRTALAATSALLALYPICLTIVFFLLSQGLSRLPKSVSDQLLLSGERVPLLPPFGLDTHGVNGKVQVLEDGSKVFDLRGEIRNSLPVLYKSLLIEGKLFDESNQLVARMIVPLNPDLQGAKIHSLTRSAIDEISRKITADDNFIAESKVRPFRLIFTGVKNPERVRYVGARVYSVER